MTANATETRTCRIDIFHHYPSLRAAWGGTLVLVGRYHAEEDEWVVRNGAGDEMVVRERDIINAEN